MCVKLEEDKSHRQSKINKQIHAVAVLVDDKMDETAENNCSFSRWHLNTREMSSKETPFLGET